MKTKAVIFDLDGTLWDARENICAAWNKVLAENYPQARRIPEEDFTSQMGKLLPDIGDELLDWLDKSERERALGLCCEYENRYLAAAGGKLFDSEKETLERLTEKYQLFIVSNCQSGYIETFLLSMSMEHYFADRLCSGQTGLVKGENIKKIIERNNIEKAVYVGDTDLDRQAADAAGIPFIWASYGFGKAEKYDAEAKSFDMLPELCALLEERRLL